MKQLLRQSGFAPALLALAFVVTGLFPQAVLADVTTGSITGTVDDATTGTPIANVKVSAASPSGNRSTTTDSHGFYVLNALAPDTYTVSFQASGYEPVATPGVTVQQAQIATLNQRISKELKTIAQVSARSAGNLVRPGVGSDVYNVSGTQLVAATGADNRPQTLYEYLGTVAGVTINGAVGTPRIRGGDVHDIGYEFDGIPVRERMFGIFTTNITNVGIGNIEVYTGGLPASDAANGTGIINSVVKSGTYPAQGHVSGIVTAPDHNNYVTFDYGGQSQNRKFSYYVAFGGTNSSNDFNYGQFTLPDYLYGGYDGPGPVKERDWVGNFHFKPDTKNDFQFLMQNGVGDFIFDYLLQNPQPKLAWNPCSGYTPNGNTYTGMSGGTAPNGQACPIGVYFGSLSNAGNIWHHYSGIGKLQWNHIINDHSYAALRIAENFNQYIFDQPEEDPNNPALENAGGPYNIDPSCPSYPYAAGTPVQVATGSAGPDLNTPCSWDIESFYGDRSSRMWLGALDYTNIVSPNLTLQLGAGQEYDRNLLAYNVRDYVSGDGTWPDWYAYSDIPTHLPYAYGSATVKAGRFTLTPGLRWQKEWYGIPAIGGGSRSVGGFVPTFSGTYQAGVNDVIRFSYGVSEDFIGSAYVYRSYPHAAGGPAPNLGYDPAKNGSTFNPEMNHSADLMWEHQFDPNTSLRFGPWFNSANGYYEQYNFVTGYTPSGAPIYSKQTYFTNSGRHHALGLELALSHIDRHPVGVSWWLSGTLDNYWTTSPSGPTSTSPLDTPLPTYFTSRNILVRASDNPLFTSALYADIHAGKYDIYPELNYQIGTFYNIGYDCPGTASSRTTRCKTAAPYMIPEMKAPGWMIANLSATYKLDDTGRNVIGVKVRNWFDQEHGTTPCFNSGSGTGCYPNDGPKSGFIGAPNSFVFQNVTTDPRRFEFFFTRQL
ncbi:MAG: carboxypeptidase regulatory-like domain-containing protein [Vulcanimicrobiaceae bacterium]